MVASVPQDDEARQRADGEERTWLAQLATGSPKAKEAATRQLFRRYAPAFQRFYERQHLPPAQAEELVQEVFIAVLRSADDYRGDAPVGAWLWRIARNALTSQYRRRRLDTVDDGEAALAFVADGGLTPEGDLLEDEYVACVRHQFEAFAVAHPKHAAALRLVAFEGLKPQEVAGRIGRTVPATREFLSQCRKRIKDFLAVCWALRPEDD
ncbi:MAG: RNA polymerase sigma factor [Candidatus Competibacterales bacterium]